MSRIAKLACTVFAGVVLHACDPASVGQTAAPQMPLPFREDFEAGLGDRWATPLGGGYEVVESGDGHGRVLALQTTDLPTYVLVRGSERWGGVRVEGDVLFPDSVDNYLGFIWGYRDDGRRIDFGSLYIKGNDGYLQANPHYDTNVGRTLYPEVRAPLEGERAIRIGEWQRFALEMVDGVAHLYVGDMAESAMVLPFGPTGPGAIGFKPRNPGGAVWIDDIEVTALEGFSNDGGDALPDYRPEARVTEWEVLGPVEAYLPEVESGGGASAPAGTAWRPFETDARGAVITGAVTEHRGARRVAYFRTVILSEERRPARLEFATVDPLALWLNDRFVGFAPRQSLAWWDAGENEDHGVVRADVELEPGENHLLVRVTGGVYASGGFFLRVVER